jgi:protein-S-isoprenylcysteine O-methyltransferase Ste14
MDKFPDTFQLVQLVFSVAVFIGRTLDLRITQRVNPICLGAGKEKLPRGFELLLVPWLVVWMMAVIISALRIPFRPLPALWTMVWVDLLPAQILGMLMILAGDIVFVWALISIGNSWRIGIDKGSTGMLVKEGAFAFSRNPIFVFFDLYFVGTFLVNSTLIFLIFAVITAMALHSQILQEEKYLSDRHGQAYQDHCRQAGRYVSLKTILKRNTRGGCRHGKINPAVQHG